MKLIARPHVIMHAFFFCTAFCACSSKPSTNSPPIAITPTANAVPSLATASEFHRRLDDAASRLGLDSYYGGPLGHRGRGIAIVGTSKSFTWYISKPVAEDDVPRVLFTVSISIDDGTTPGPPNSIAMDVGQEKLIVTGEVPPSSTPDAPAKMKELLQVLNGGGPERGDGLTK